MNFRGAADGLCYTDYDIIQVYTNIFRSRHRRYECAIQFRTVSANVDFSRGLIWLPREKTPSLMVTWIWRPGGISEVKLRLKILSPRMTSGDWQPKVYWRICGKSKAKETATDSDSEDADVCDKLPQTSENHHTVLQSTMWKPQHGLTRFRPHSSLK